MINWVWGEGREEVRDEFRFLVVKYSEWVIWKVGKFFLEMIIVRI